MKEGDIEFYMYLVVVKYFRPPIYIKAHQSEMGSFFQPSDADTYLVFDDLDQPIAWIKIYFAENSAEEKTIEEQINAISWISSQKLNHSLPGIPLEFSLAKIEGATKRYITLFSLQEGKSMLQHIRYLGEQREDSLERFQAFEILSKGYEKVAIALAELHSKKFSPLCKISPYYLKTHQEACRKLINSLKPWAEKLPFELSEFSSRVMQLVDAAYQRPCSASFLHGNPMPEALYYEPFHGVLSLMEMEQAYHSVSASGMPCGPSAYDFVWAEASLEVQLALILATREESQEILANYRRVYQADMRERYPSALHLRFYQVLFWLPIYKKLLARYEKEELMSAPDHRLFHVALARVQAVFHD